VHPAAVQPARPARRPAGVLLHHHHMRSGHAGRRGRRLRGGIGSHRVTESCSRGRERP
jgi:hypothetical protein